MCVLEKHTCRIEGFKGERELQTLIWKKKTYEEQQYFKSEQSRHEQARELLLEGESRFMLDSTLKMPTLGCYSRKESPFC